MKNYIPFPAQLHWATPAINEMSAAGIIGGYPDGRFGPGNNITRAEAVVMIARLLGRSDTWKSGKSFPDVSPSHWAYKEIMNAVNGL